MASRLPYVDYILVYPAADRKFTEFRNLFEESIKKEGLQMESDQLADRVFVKIFCPFERLALQAEMNQMKMPLKGCLIPKRPKTCVERLLKFLTADDTVDLVSAPFDKSKLHLYDGGDDTPNFFRNSVRNLLVHQILISVDIRDQLNDSNGKLKIGRSCRRGLLHLVMIKAYSDAFVLHDRSAIDNEEVEVGTDSNQGERHRSEPKIHFDPRWDLKKTWLKWWKFQPLGQIRNYFGEKIALYFAWLGHYILLLWLPALAGLAIFIYGVHYRFANNPVRLSQCVSSLVNRSSTNCDALTTAKHLAGDVLDTVNDAFDNRATPFFSLVICLWSFLFMKLWARLCSSLVYRWDVDNFKDSEPDRPEFVGTSFELKYRRYLISVLVILLMIMVVFTSVALVILFKVAVREALSCPVTEKDADDPTKHYDPTACFFALTLAPAIFNAVSIMVLGKLYAKLARSLTKWENHRTKSSYNDALILKLFAFQFANNYSSLFYIAFFRPEEHFFQRNGIFGLGTHYKDTCARGTCMSLLSFQVFVLMLTKPFPKFFNDILLPWLKTRLRRLKKCCRNRKNSVSDTRPIRTEDQLQTDSRENFFEKEFHKPTTGDFTLGEYMEKVLLHGYVVLFAASFPLAPFLALMINLFDLRVDAKRLLCWNRRPIGHIAAGIGMWRSIMNFLNLCGVVSNALLVAYTSAFCSDYFGDNVSAKERLSTLVIFEHLALAIAYILSVSIPDVPSHIVLAQKKERHQVAKLLENAAATYPFPRRSETELRRNPSLTEIEMRKFADGTTSNDTLDTSLQEDSSRSEPQLTEEKERQRAILEDD